MPDGISNHSAVACKPPALIHRMSIVNSLAGRNRAIISPSFSGNSMKRSWKIFLWGLALVGIAFVVLVAPEIRAHRQMIYPTPLSCSVFLRNYDPKRVVDLFDSQEGSSLSGGHGQSAGFRFIKNDREITPVFALQNTRRPQLMRALNNDILAQLTANGVSVVSHSGDPQSGFQYSYQIGRTTGTVSLSPVRPSANVHRNTPLPDGIEDTTFTITIVEKWFPGTPG
jgi:hypothetical protein